MLTHYHVKRRCSKLLHYQYQIAHSVLCIINSTKDIVEFNNFVVLNILR